MPLCSLFRALCSALLFSAFTAPSLAQAPTVAFKLIETPFTVGPVNGVAFGNGTFVVSTATATSLRVFSSLDGLRWQEAILRPPPPPRSTARSVSPTGNSSSTTSPW